jgi:hypothetical protein
MRSTSGKGVSAADPNFVLRAREDGIPPEQSHAKRTDATTAPHWGEGWSRGRLAQGRPRSRIRHPRMGP